MRNEKLCMIPGPVEVHDDVLSAMGTKATSHVDPEFISIFGNAIKMLRMLFGTEKGQPFVLSGSGTLGWDAVVSNLVEPSENVLVINTGYFGDSFGECAETYGANVEHVRAKSIGDIASLEDIKAQLQSKKFKLINITHVDTSSGVLTNIPSISKLVKEVSPDTLISVDGVCSIGAERFYMDAWDVDVIITASQKAIGVPSGLCIMAYSQRAMKTVFNRSVPIRSYFANLTRWLPIMEAYELGKPSYFATPAVSLVIALSVSLKLILEQGLQNVFKAHEDASDLVKKTLTSRGLKLVPVNMDVAAHSLTAVYYPEGVTASDLLPLITKENVVVAGGLHKQIASKYFRVGHMGVSAVDSKRTDVSDTLKAIGKALDILKK